jgi:hypothetical protein
MEMKGAKESMTLAADKTREEVTSALFLKASSRKRAIPVLW